MAVTYPYTSGQGAIIKTIEQFRKQFPATVDADVLKKFGIAPGNESYIINIIRFLGLIDGDGKRVEEATSFFYDDQAGFATGLEKQITAAYKPLFDDHGDGVWEEGKDSLSTWFRVTDKTSELIGGRQASTFVTLASLAGHGEVKAAQASTKAAAKKTAPPAKKTAAKKTATPAESLLGGSNDSGNGGGNQPHDVGLSVRIEVNLPANGTPDVYDAIFASVRKHLIDRG